MVGVFLGIFAVLLVITPILWGYSRFQKAGQAPRTIDPTSMAQVVRVDLEDIKAIPQLAPAVDRVKWAKFRKERGGRTIAGGDIVFGPQRLTWAPDDQCRRLGTASWQVPWTDIEGAEVREPTATSSAMLVITLVGGVDLELVGVDAERSQAAIDKFVKPQGADPGE